MKLVFFVENCKLLRIVILQSEARLGIRLQCQHVNNALSLDNALKPCIASYFLLQT